ncbi:hypothetical protein ACTS9E_01600 [Empedobacter brevis]
MRTLLHHLVVPLLLCTGVAWGQEQVEIVINPFGKDTIVSKIKKGNTIKFKINNVNTFRINGITETKPLNINFEVPEIFKNFIALKTEDDELLPTLSEELERIINDAKRYNKNLDIASLQDVLDKIKKNETIKEKEINQKQSELEFVIFFSSFINKYHKLQQQIALEEKVSEQIKDSIFIENIKVLKDNVKQYFNVVYDNKSKEDAKKETELVINSLMIDYSKLKKLYDELNKTLEKESVILNGNLISEDKKTVIKIEKATVSQDRKKYFLEEMVFAKKAFEIISDIKNRNEIIKKAQSGIDMYNQIENASFIVYTDGEQINDDEVTITPKLKFSNGKIAHEFKPLTIKSYGGIKVNFSAGYMLSFIGNDEFVLKYNKEGEVVGVSQLTKNAITHAVGGLAHVLWGYNNFSYGLSAGLSTNTDAKLNFYGGASLAFLEKNRLVFTLGISYTNVQRLNRSNLNEENEFISPKLTDISYTAVYKPAWFFGVTYNLSNNGK